jgi:hypothetical protein
MTLERLDVQPAGHRLAAPLEAPEYDLSEGYVLWSKTYDRLLRLFPIEHPTMRALLGPLPASTALDAACGTWRGSDPGSRVRGSQRARGEEPSISGGAGL